MAGNANSGRKSKDYLRRSLEQIITETSPEALKYLQMVARGTVEPYTVTTITATGKTTQRQVSGVDPIRVDVCKYIINQDIGSPRQRTELTGNVNLSWTELMRLSVTSADIEQLPADKPAEIEQITSQD